MPPPFVAGTPSPGVGDAETAESTEAGEGGQAPKTAPPKVGTKTRSAAPAEDDDQAEKQDQWDERKRRFGRAVAHRLNFELGRVDDLGIDGLRLAAEILADGLPGWALVLLAQLRGWVAPDVDEVSHHDWAPHIAAANGRELAEVLVLLTVVQPLSEGISLTGLDDDVRVIAKAYGLFLPALWHEAAAPTPVGHATSAAGAARRKLDATEVFVAQHAPADTPSASHSEAEAEPDWPWPGDEAQNRALNRRQ